MFPMRGTLSDRRKAESPRSKSGGAGRGGPPVLAKKKKKKKKKKKNSLGSRQGDAGENQSLREERRIRGHNPPMRQRAVPQ